MFVVFLTLLFLLERNVFRARAKVTLPPVGSTHATGVYTAAVSATPGNHVPPTIDVDVASEEQRVKDGDTRKFTVLSCAVVLPTHSYTVLDRFEMFSLINCTR